MFESWLVTTCKNVAVWILRICKNIKTSYHMNKWVFKLITCNMFIMCTFLLLYNKFCECLLRWTDEGQISQESVLCIFCVSTILGVWLDTFSMKLTKSKLLGTNYGMKIFINDVSVSGCLLMRMVTVVFFISSK